MKMFRCKFSTDIIGIYITPLIGYSNIRNIKSFWIGWIVWLFEVQYSDGNILNKNIKDKIKENNEN